MFSQVCHFDFSRRADRRWAPRRGGDRVLSGYGRFATGFAPLPPGWCAGLRPEAVAFGVDALLMVRGRRAPGRSRIPCGDGRGLRPLFLRCVPCRAVPSTPVVLDRPPPADEVFRPPALEKERGGFFHLQCGM